MPQFFVEHIEDPLEIRGKEARHLQEVLRLGVGDWVVLCDGAGTRCKCEIVASKPLHVTLVQRERLPDIHLPTHITLAAAIIRPERFEWMIEKAFELGCRRFIPLQTARTVASYFKPRQVTRWNEIALSAAKQSGLPFLPEVSDPQPLLALLKTGGPFQYCWEGLAGQRATPVMPQKAVTLLIGPEGGFAPEEHEAILQTQPQMMSLGPLILRSETAAIAALVKRL